MFTSHSRHYSSVPVAIESEAQEEGELRYPMIQDTQYYVRASVLHQSGYGAHICHFLKVQLDIY
jgi:hypothetical protein